MASHLDTGTGNSLWGTVQGVMKGTAMEIFWTLKRKEKKLAKGGKTILSSWLYILYKRKELGRAGGGCWHPGVTAHDDEITQGLTPRLSPPQGLSEYFHLLCSLFCCCCGSCSVSLILCDPVGCSLPGSVYGVYLARTLEWVAVSFSRDLLDPRIKPQVSCIAGRFFTIWTTRKTPLSTLPGL